MSDVDINTKGPMMHDMMSGMGAMMTGMTLIGVLVLILFALGITALVKYVFFR